ncbi:TPA: Tn3 family transposase post-transcriptional regulator TnpC [Pseudomonas aeruginosa]|nr:MULTISPECIES: Tn3 family transposase post-transcriptional regulator TnpC [Pseudomonas]MBI8343328.1 transposase [Pseudomonas aeruginosa]MDZ4194448.1 Tn3 family transposase post-transcriptional regulator TnpC [Pseudomonas sp.]UZT76850.1 transposase [Pseudomonas chengduensis]
MIDIPPASFRVTPYGEVDTTALEQLRDSFDTAQLLRLVDRLDACLAEPGGITALRDELLRLHAMALTLVEGVAPTVPTENACIWAEAESVQLDLEALASWVRSAQIGIAPLIDLVPAHEQ